MHVSASIDTVHLTRSPLQINWGLLREMPEGKEDPSPSSSYIEAHSGQPEHYLMSQGTTTPRSDAADVPVGQKRSGGVSPREATPQRFMRTEDHSSPSSDRSAGVVEGARGKLLALDCGAKAEANGGVPTFPVGSEPPSQIGGGRTGHEASGIGGSPRGNPKGTSSSCGPGSIGSDDLRPGAAETEGIGIVGGGGGVASGGGGVRRCAHGQLWCPCSQEAKWDATVAVTFREGRKVYMEAHHGFCSQHLY